MLDQARELTVGEKVARGAMEGIVFICAAINVHNLNRRCTATEIDAMHEQFYI